MHKYPRWVNTSYCIYSFPAYIEDGLPEWWLITYDKFGDSVRQLCFSTNFNLLCLEELNEIQPGACRCLKHKVIFAYNFMFVLLVEFEPNTLLTLNLTPIQTRYKHSIV